MLLCAGEFTLTPASLVTWIVTCNLSVPPQLSHSWTVVLYVPGFKFRVASSLAPFETWAKALSAV